MTVRIAMWSGPRNISTAMMRSWENRADCSVVDEPFYACYLRETGLQHPCRDDILAAQSDNRERVIAQLTREPVETALFYQKHMTHHMPRGMPMYWCEQLRHVFLIRDPTEVIASYLEKMPTVTEDDIGIVRQGELFREINEITGVPPQVIDSNDVLRNPEAVLRALCDGLDIAFDEGMLSWPPGPRNSDGVWAHHWYGNVETSTGFAPYRPRTVRLAPEHRELAQRMGDHYQVLAERRIRV